MTWTAFRCTAPGADQILHLSNSPGITPKGYATYGGQRDNSNPVSLRPVMEINATVLSSEVPEPATFGPGFRVLRFAS